MIGQRFRSECRVASRLIGAGAISAETAREFEKFHWPDTRRVKHLVTQGLVHATPTGSLWIDQAAWAPYYERQRKLRFVPGAILLSGMIVGTFLHRVVWPLISDWAARTFAGR
jgi:hypothetical protein